MDLGILHVRYSLDPNSKEVRRSVNNVCHVNGLAIVFYKNEFAMSTTYLNLYMIYGGTNWGGIAHPGMPASCVS